jgi:Tfp pilus assembly protein, ATPase PilU
VEKEVSDLFFTANAPIKIKIDGKIVSVGKTILNTSSYEQNRA